MTDNYTFSTTGYAGFEDQILRLRNANRSIPQNLKYLQWRYAKYSDLPDPLIFWIKSSRGDAVGVAALIYRSYWLNNKPIKLGVIGDISLDLSLRGKGLGSQLLKYVRKYIDQNLPECIAFVIPNDAAKRSLLSANWSIGGNLIPYVLPLSPASKLSIKLGSDLIGRIASSIIRKAISIIARLHLKAGYEMQFVSCFDSSFEDLWLSISKDSIILSDRSIATLNWRYMNHPHKSYAIAKLLRKGTLSGYLIYNLVQSDNECHICDLIVKDKKDLLCMLALFCLDQIKNKVSETVRLVLSDTHPYRNDLRKIGFIRREDHSSFLIHWPSSFVHDIPTNWMLSHGDKDI